MKRQYPHFLDLIPKRSLQTHKGKCGRVAVIAGSESMIGAAILTAKAALSTGAGLVYLLTLDKAVPELNIHYPEIIVLPLPHKQGWITREATKQIQKYAQDYNFHCAAIGPGLGRQEDVQEWIKKTVVWMSQIMPLVVDADAIIACKDLDFKQIEKQKMVLTPHPKEFEALSGIAVGGEDKERIAKAGEVARRLNQIMVLKGFHSIVSNDQSYYMNLTGNPGMATAGAGDVLTGVIASWIGQGVSPLQAAMLGNYVHGLAGDIAFQKKDIGLVAHDIVEEIPMAIKEIKQGPRA